MAFTKYRDLVRALATGWTRSYWGERLFGTIGVLGDAVMDAATQALVAPWLLAKTSPPDALPPVGRERLMPRYPAESDATYRNRLYAAWTAWGFGGNEVALLDQYRWWNLLAVRVINAAHWVFEWPRNAANFSRFAVVVEQPHPWAGPHLYGSSNRLYGDGCTYGSTATVPEVATLRGIARQWKAGHDINPAIWLIFTGHYYGEAITYGTPGLTYGGSTTLRMPHQE